MSKILLLGATGSLGGHVLRQAIAAGHEVTVLVREPARLPAGTHDRVAVHTGDLSVALPPSVVRGHQVLINCAGNVADGGHFVGLVGRIVAAVESLPPAQRPICWFLAGAALLDIDSAGRRGVELPNVRATYWPHELNFARLQRSAIDWRLLCPGPMVEQPALGLRRLRISIDRLPVEAPDLGRTVPHSVALPLFASLIPQMIVPYADAAALMLANLEHGNAMARHRIGLALPIGMHGRKPEGIGARARPING